MAPPIPPKSPTVEKAGKAKPAPKPKDSTAPSDNPSAAAGKAPSAGTSDTPGGSTNTSETNEPLASFNQQMFLLDYAAEKCKRLKI